MRINIQPPQTFTFSQSSPSDTWVIVHKLGKKPEVVVIDSAISTIYGAINYDSDNQLTITFNGATSGNAYLS